MKTSALKLALHHWPYGLVIEPSRSGLVLRPRRTARANWAKNFRRLLRSTDDLATTRQLTNEFDGKEWKW